MTSNRPVKILLDCDTGIDDALAILYLAAQRDVSIVAAGAVHGNVSADLAATNTLRVLEIAGLLDVPVAVGARRPMAQDLKTAEYVHGADGLGNVGHPMPRGKVTAEPAAMQIVRLAREQPGELTLLATGPLTNVGVALLLEPELPTLLRRVVVMGGAVYYPGNATNDAEANIWHDPEAADLVLTAGWPLTLVGLDVTSTARVTDQEIALFRDSDSALARFAWKIMQFYFDFYFEYLGERACLMHDPVAAALAIHPDWATYRDTPVRVELRGHLTRGATRGRPPWKASDPDGPPVSVAMTLDLERFKSSFIGALLPR